MFLRNMFGVGTPRTFHILTKSQIRENWDIDIMGCTYQKEPYRQHRISAANFINRSDPKELKKLYAESINKVLNEYQPLYYVLTRKHNGLYRQISSIDKYLSGGVPDKTISFVYGDKVYLYNENHIGSLINEDYVNRVNAQRETKKIQKEQEWAELMRQKNERNQILREEKRRQEEAEKQRREFERQQYLQQQEQQRIQRELQQKQEQERQRLEQERYEREQAQKARELEEAWKRYKTNSGLKPNE